MPVAPFTAFFDSSDSLPYFNYAIPDRTVGGDLGGAIEQLRAAFAARRRVARFEFVEGFAPHLAASLCEAGFSEELRTSLLTCSRSRLRLPAPVEGLVIQELRDGMPLELLRESLTIARRAFGQGDEPDATRQEIEQLRGRPIGDRKLVGLLEGKPVAVATALAPLDGLSEIAGVAVLARFRGRGIGSAMTAAATQAAFEAGAELALLTPGDESALRIYERAGFAARETMLFYIDDPALSISGPAFV